MPIPFLILDLDNEYIFPTGNKFINETENNSVIFDKHGDDILFSDTTKKCMTEKAE